MFLGQYEVAVDALGRLELPESFAGPLAAGAIVTQGFDSHLIVMPAAVFSAWAAQISALSKTDPLARLLARLVMGNAAPVSLDARGGVSLPQSLRTLGCIEHQSVVVGGGDLFEIWAPEAWSRQQATLQDTHSNPGRFAALPLIVTA